MQEQDHDIISGLSTLRGTLPILGFLFLEIDELLVDTETVGFLHELCDITRNLLIKNWQHDEGSNLW